MATATGASITEIERALSLLFRWGNLPRVRDRFAAEAGVHVDRASYAIIARLDEAGPLRISELAHKVGVDTSTASRQVGPLEKDGFVTRLADPLDGRAHLLDVTPRGRRAVRRRKEARRRILSQLLADFSEEDRAQLAILLDRLTENLIEWAGGDR
ncbi:MAG: MarR family winged helix-turn-helix transcriptional regulator [Actinomycetota bacterium]